MNVREDPPLVHYLREHFVSNKSFKNIPTVVLSGRDFEVI